MEMHGLGIADVKSLLQHCLTNNNLRFGDEFFRQTTGIAMGSRVAPPLAIIFMGELEKQYLQTAHLKPALYMRYIDDVIGVWTHGEEALDEFLNHINNAHPSIKFTMESTKNHSRLAFLDTLITLKDNRYSTELFIKPTSSGVVMHFTSAQPRQTKKAVLTSQFKRATRLSSDDEAKQRSFEKLTKIFESNGYPSSMVKSAINRVQTTTSKKKEERRKNNERRICLPFIDDQLSQTINSILKKSGLGVRAAWSNKNTIKRKLVRSALKPPPCPAGRRMCNTCSAGLKGQCHSSGVVYEMKCKLCTGNNSYVGETGRKVRTRYNEHLADARYEREETAWGEHWRNHHHSIDPRPDDISIKILKKQINDIRDRKIYESIEIRNRNPNINTQQSSWGMLH